MRLSWAKLPKREFKSDVRDCPTGELTIISAFLQQQVIQKILTIMGLQAGAAPRAPARGQAMHTP
ncbi:MAG: hypothetical protein ACKVQR_05045 [Aquabacterium sp.]